MNLTILVEEVIKISLKAGKEILKIYNAQNYDVQYKSDDSPITIADEISNKIITEDLSKLVPLFPVISEEGAVILFSDRQDFEYFWLVDPLDGTKEFVSRTDDFAVNIALIHHNQPILGVVYVPCTEGVFYAVKNEGAYKIDNNVRHQIQCSTFKITDSNLKVPVSRSYLNEETKTLIAERYDKPVLVPRGSALKFTDIAEGNADIYPRIGTTMEWDTAAPQIILEEAGGKILHLETGKPLFYNKESLKNPNFIAMAQIIE